MVRWLGLHERRQTLSALVAGWTAPNTPAHEARISDRIPDTAFPFRVFYYSPGMGFDTGNLVYVGRNEYRTRSEAETAAAKWLEARK